MSRGKGGYQRFRLRYTYTDDAITQRLKEGRGEGHLATYTPLILTHEVSGVNTFRLVGRKTGRIHHLLSTQEADLFYLLDLRPGVEDIRERFPLLPREEVMGIAEERGLPYPRDRKTGVPRVLSTDFLLDIRRGDTVQLEAWAYHPEEFLQRRNFLVQLELERAYWERRNVRWRMVTDREMPPALRHNARWLHGYLTSGELGLEDADFMETAEWITAAVQAHPRQVLAELCLQSDAVFGYRPGTTLGVARNLLARGCWVVDRSRRIRPTEPLPLRAVRAITADGGGGIAW